MPCVGTDATASGRVFAWEEGPGIGGGGDGLELGDVRDCEGVGSEGSW